MINVAAALDEAVKVVCPITGVSIGNRSDKTTWNIDFAEAATPQQRTAAQAVIDAFDVNAAYPSAQQLEDACKAAFNAGGGNVDLFKLVKALAIDREAYRLGKAPGALTAGELASLRDRIAAIYKAL